MGRTDSNTIAVIEPETSMVLQDQVLYVGTRKDITQIDTGSSVVGKAIPDPLRAAGAAVGAGSPLALLTRSKRTVDRTALKKTGKPSANRSISPSTPTRSSSDWTVWAIDLEGRREDGDRPVAAGG